jgi:hypothetical protein
LLVPTFPPRHAGDVLRKDQVESVINWRIVANFALFVEVCKRSDTAYLAGSLDEAQRSRGFTG